eukprot:m.79638 g.79638  ORF g.79638 m.79638 type:complete len:282 (-) comp11983_c0_seq2:210-1055(-)
MSLLVSLVSLLLVATRCDVVVSLLCEETNGYHPVMVEEFVDQHLNNSIWNVVVGKDAGLGRDATLTAANVIVGGGILTLSTHRYPIGNTSLFNFTSGAVITKDKQKWTFGRFCVHARLPGVPGYSQGVWPAHWLMPNDNSCDPDHGEIDIMEMVNGDSVTYGTFHYSDAKTNCTGEDSKLSGSATVSDWDEEYHEYGVEWEEDHIAFYLDGAMFKNITLNSISNKETHPKIPTIPFYFLLNTAIGKNVLILLLYTEYKFQTISLLMFTYDQKRRSLAWGAK